jgi:hypothetical protein
MTGGLMQLVAYGA